MRLLALRSRWKAVSPRRRLGLELAVLAGLLAVAVPVFQQTIGWNMLAPIKSVYRTAYAYIYFPVQARHDPERGSALTLPSHEQREYAKRLNGYYFPRVYLIDPQGYLRYVQHYRTGSQRALMEAVWLLPKEVK
ncbi:MAG: hypothetical protein N2651_10210 [Fimbriimonadales bacterium]|nr:hypothetical protein [Fimbriimonadales bacterium]